MLMLIQNLTVTSTSRHVKQFKNYIDDLQAGVLRTEVEEPSIGEKLLLAGLEVCDKVGEERVTLAARLAAHNQLGILWCQRDDMIKARQHLEKALNIYFNFRQAENKQDLVLLRKLLFP